MQTNCTSSDARYSAGSKIYGPIRYALRMARASRENGLLEQTAYYLNQAARLRRDQSV